MEMTALGPFTERLAGQLSGGMKQKLGLACTLVRSPELLLLDEPTVGVDPLSRRELWEIILQLVDDEGLTVLSARPTWTRPSAAGTSVVLHQGKVLAQGAPADDHRHGAPGARSSATPPTGQAARALQARLLRRPGRRRRGAGRRAGARRACGRAPDGDRRSRSASATAHGRAGAAALRRRLHGAAARRPSRDAAGVDRAARRAARATPMTAVVGRGPRPGAAVRRLHRRRSRQLRGAPRRDLRPARAERRRQDHHLPHALRPACRRPAARSQVAGVDLRTRAPRPASASATSRRSSRSTASSRSIENLEFFASAYGLRGGRKRERIAWAMQQFELTPLRRACRAGSCPAATSSAWRWRRRCCTSRRSCSWTSRPAAPIRWRGASSGGGSPRWPSRA